MVYETIKYIIILELVFIILGPFLQIINVGRLILIAQMFK